MKTLVNLYGVLGVARTADDAALRRAYRRLARKHHPDVNSDPKSHDLMARINEAFQTLIDPERRLEYDAMLKAGLLDDPAEAPAERIKKPVLVRLSHRLKMHRTPIYSVGFSPSNGALISSSFDNELYWLDRERNGIQRRMKLEGNVVSTLLPMLGERVVAAGASENTITFWHLAGGKIGAWRNSPSEWVTCLAISPNGQTLATGSVQRTVSLWSTDNGGKVYDRRDHQSSITAVAWSADGRYLATGSADASVKLRHASNGAVLHTFGGIRATVTAIAFSGDSNYMAVACVDYSIRVFRLSDGLLQKVLFGHSRPIEALAFHPNGWLFASGGRDGQVVLWNAGEGLGKLQIEASTLPVAAVAFSPDGKSLAAGGLDKTLRIWGLDVRQPF